MPHTSPHQERNTTGSPRPSALPLRIVGEVRAGTPHHCFNAAPENLNLSGTMILVTDDLGLDLFGVVSGDVVLVSTKELSTWTPDRFDGRLVCARDHLGRMHFGKLRNTEIRNGNGVRPIDDLEIIGVVQLNLHYFP